MVWYHKQDIWRVFHEVEVYNENQNTQKMPIWLFIINL